MQAATLDQISQGLFLFGVTAGWDDLLFRNHGIDPALRWQVMREKVLAVKELWTQPQAQFHGALPISRPSCAYGPSSPRIRRFWWEATARPGFAVSWSTATSGSRGSRT